MEIYLISMSWQVTFSKEKKKNLMVLWSSTLVVLCTVLRVKKLGRGGMNGQTWSSRGGREAEGTMKTTKVKFLDKTEPFPIGAEPPKPRVSV